MPGLRGYDPDVRWTSGLCWLALPRWGSDVTAERSRPVLRALRREPLLVEDTLAAARLAQSASRPGLGTGPAADAADRLRWSRAWLVCAQAALVADERYGREDPWSVDLALANITSPRGGGDHHRQRQLLGELQAAGVLRVDGGAPFESPSVRISLARDMFTEHRAAVAIDWPLLVERSGAEPAQLLVARALADLVAPLDAFTAVPRRDLVARTGYQLKQVRTALRRLISSGLVEAEGDAGITARYRFSALALGRGWDQPTVDSTSVGHWGVASTVAPVPMGDGAAPRVRDATQRPSVARTTSAAPVRAMDGVEVAIGGATITIASGGSFQVGAGLTARAELEENGRVRLVIEPQPRET